MSQPRHLAAPPGMVPVMGMQRPPTDAERAEAEHNRFRQLRQNAIALAVQAGGGQGVEIGDALADAVRIATYIETGEVRADAGAPSPQPGE